ncbi:MAG: hypothetical protein H0Z24_06775 [Thermosipho sp. (in: Bacteria)]|nr:hypothetical protein [Thermosipho sp. (in: thermotogales)]
MQRLIKTIILGLATGFWLATAIISIQNKEIFNAVVSSLATAFLIVYFYFRVYKGAEEE